jgi:hypothetical protein
MELNVYVFCVWMMQNQFQQCQVSSVITMCMIIVFSCLYPTSPNNLLSQRTYFVAWVQAMYFAYINEKAIRACFLLAQEIVVSSRRKT